MSTWASLLFVSLIKIPRKIFFFKKDIVQRVSFPSRDFGPEPGSSLSLELFLKDAGADRSMTTGWRSTKVVALVAGDRRQQKVESSIATASYV